MDKKPDWTTQGSKVLVIFVGGTIGMKCVDGVYVPVKDYMRGALKAMPMFNDAEAAEELGVPDDVFVVPKNKNDRHVFFELYEYEELKDSSNLKIHDWVDMVNDIYRFYRKYDGFVILHGTDTMAYTASALSFMLHNQDKPVVVTGAQVPLAELRSDGRDNMLGAIYVAGTYAIPEVTLFFNQMLFRGNRTVKKSSDSFAAFASPNYPTLLKLYVNDEVNWDDIFRPIQTGSFSVSTTMNDNVGLMKIFPSMTVATIKTFLSPPVQGVVLQTFGAGNGPDSEPDIMKEIKAASDRGVLIVNVTQCFDGMVSPSYHTGEVLLEAGVIPGSDLTAEAAFGKLCYVLGKEGLTDQGRRDMMKRSLRGEMASTEFVDAATDSIRNMKKEGKVSDSTLILPPMMCAAAANGDIQALQHLKASGGDLTAGEYNGRTPLHLAASKGHLNIVKYLLKNGCSVYKQDDFGKTPLDEGVRFKNLEVIKLLRQAGGKHVYQPKEVIGSKLIRAVSVDDSGGLKALYTAGANLNAADHWGNTALYRAASGNKLKSLQFLVNTMEFDESGSDTSTALKLAMDAGNAEAARIIREGKNVKATSEEY